MDPNHPDGNYEMANEVLVFEPPNVISWQPGYAADDGRLRFGGWTWRYDLTTQTLGNGAYHPSAATTCMPSQRPG
jgi:hypothetical protein